MAVLPVERPRRARSVHVEPFVACCPVCRAEVLQVWCAGREVVVEVREVLPAHDCVACRQVALRGHIRSSCDRCHMTGIVGEPVPLRGVALDEDGRAREYRKRQFRRGECVLRYHACP